MSSLLWWQKAVIYEVWPRSFADLNCDGIGDLPGITAKLDYLKNLGVDAIWLGPHYPSPQFDTGYDVANYSDVAMEYGTLADFKRLLDEAHQRGIRLTLDLVLNHTSSHHAWFWESRSSRNNLKRDWYVWRDGKNGGPPNNWLSIFGGSAWQLDETTGQYYYHMFLKDQPDLNWNNPEVKQAIFNAVRFWLDMGVDGFRLDAVGAIFEDPNLPDHDGDLGQFELFKQVYGRKTPEEARTLGAKFERVFRYQIDMPGVHNVIKHLRALVDTYDERLLLAEADDVSYYGSGNDEFHLAFNFPLMRTNRLTPDWVRANQVERLSKLPPGAWPCNTLNNHDCSRVWSKYGDGVNDAELARLAITLIMTLRGTPVLYYGEEIGMQDYNIPNILLFRDKVNEWAYHVVISEMGMTPAEALAFANITTRDKCRSPMQWSSAPNGGFCPADRTTWQPMNPNYAQGINVADQDKDPDSMLNFYRRLLKMRRETPALISGGYTPIHEDAKDYLAFLRSSPEDKQTILVVLNFFEKPVTLRFAPQLCVEARLVFSSHKRKPTEALSDHLTLAPFEIYISEI